MEQSILIQKLPVEISPTHTIKWAILKWQKLTSGKAKKDNNITLYEQKKTDDYETISQTFNNTEKRYYLFCSDSVKTQESITIDNQRKILKTLLLFFKAI